MKMQEKLNATATQICAHIAGVCGGGGSAEEIETLPAVVNALVNFPGSPSKDDAKMVIEAMREFIARTASGKGTPEEVRILPGIIGAMNYFVGYARFNE